MKIKLKEKFSGSVNILIDEYDITEEEANKMIDEMLRNPIKDLEQNNRHIREKICIFCKIKFFYFNLLKSILFGY